LGIESDGEIDKAFQEKKGKIGKHIISIVREEALMRVCMGVQIDVDAYAEIRVLLCTNYVILPNPQLIRAYDSTLNLHR
jgi:hypothetical protein